MSEDERENDIETSDEPSNDYIVEVAEPYTHAATEMPRFFTNYMSEIFRKTNENITCPICFDAITFSNNVSILFCGHIFHQECKSKVFQSCSTCPCCYNPLFRLEIK
jgi:hypothetical protein